MGGLLPLATAGLGLRHSIDSCLGCARFNALCLDGGRCVFHGRTRICCTIAAACRHCLRTTAAAAAAVADAAAAAVAVAAEMQEVSR